MSTDAYPQGQFACTRCAHDQADHDDIEGCSHCRCAANRSEAQSTVHYAGGAKPYLGRIFGPGAYLHEWQVPEPEVERDTNLLHDPDGSPYPEEVQALYRETLARMYADHLGHERIGDMLRDALESVAKVAWEGGFQDGQRQDAEGDDGPRFVNPHTRGLLR